MNLFKFTVEIITVENVTGFNITSPNENDIYDFRDNLFSIFATEVDGVFQVNCYQVLTPEIRAQIITFIDKYKKQLHQLNALHPFFKAINDGDSFFILPNTHTNTRQLVDFQGYLRSLKEGIDYEIIRNETDDLFGQSLDKYTIGIIGPKRKWIGEEDKAKRICRFCGKPNGETTFNKRAHAISEAIGNKTIRLFDECDLCNEKFSKTIEPDVIEYFALFRSLFKVMGKGGLKKHEGKNFEIVDKPGEPFTIKYISQNGNGSDEGKLIELISGKKVTRQNIYKSLCKFFISVIPAEYLPKFSDTIDWINGDLKVEYLPKIAEMVSYHSFSQQPKLAYYIRKNNDTKIPYAVGEFYFTCKVLIFIVPLIADEKDFLSEDDYGAFWETFQHYKRSKGWVFADFSSNEAVEFSTNVEIEINEDL